MPRSSPRWTMSLTGRPELQTQQDGSQGSQNESPGTKNERKYPEHREEKRIVIPRDIFGSEARDEYLINSYVQADQPNAYAERPDQEFLHSP